MEDSKDKIRKAYNKNKRGQKKEQEKEDPTSIAKYPNATF